MRFLAGLAIPLAAAIFLSGWIGGRVTAPDPAPSCSVRVGHTDTSVTATGKHYLLGCTGALTFWPGSYLATPYQHEVCSFNDHDLTYTVRDSKPDRWAVLECESAKHPHWM